MSRRRRKRNSQPEPRGIVWTKGDITHGKVTIGTVTVALVASTDRGFVENAVRYYNEPMRGREHLAIIKGGAR